MKKSIIVSFVLSFVSVFSFAQNVQFGMHTEIGGGVALDYRSFSNLQLHMSPGFRLSPSWFLGMGVGLNYHMASNSSVQLVPLNPENPYLETQGLNFFSIPIYAHATYTLPIHGAWTPYVNLKLGYGIVDASYEHRYGDDHKRFERAGGLYLSPALGVKYKLNTKHALSFSISYDMQNYKTSGYPIFELSGIRDYVVYQQQMGSLAFRLGWQF